MAELIDNTGTVLEVPRLQARDFRESEENESLFLDPETCGLPTLFHTLELIGIGLIFQSLRHMSPWA